MMLKELHDTSQCDHRIRARDDGCYVKQGDSTCSVTTFFTRVLQHAYPYLPQQ